MGWRSGTVMDNRLEFVRLAEAGGVSISELCRRFGVSRETGHLWLRRYREGGIPALANRSSRPRNSPLQTEDALEQRILALRAEHPAWGGRKLHRRLCDQGVAGVPSASTITEVLRRHGKLLPPDGVGDPPARRRFERSEPNDLWQMDFKGHFAMERGRCHPLTALDDHSRYLVGLNACADETELTVRTCLTAIFRRYGLPRAILCDNGNPWGSAGANSFTRLEVWLMRLGIWPCHGRPYHPQTQGKDERFHRTLSVELLQGRRIAGLDACQPLFDGFREIYNMQRPHEALKMATPSSRYQASPVAFPDTLPVPDYHATDVVRLVRPDGAISLRGRRIKLSEGFARQRVALRPSQVDGVFTVHFMSFTIAEVDLRGGEVIVARRHRGAIDPVAPEMAP